MPPTQRTCRAARESARWLRHSVSRPLGAGQITEAPNLGPHSGSAFSAAAGALHVDSSAVILVNFASTTRTFITRSSPTTKKEPRRKRAQVGCHLRKRVVNSPADHSFPPIKEGVEAQPCRQVFAD